MADRFKKGVVNGLDAPVLQNKEVTIAEKLKSIGYRTAMMEKWHIGVGVVSEDIEVNKYISPLLNAPVDHGFDSWFGIVASLNFNPYTYFNDRTPRQPTHTVQDRFQDGRAEFCSQEFVHADVLEQLTDSLVAYIEEHARDTQPFFVYFPITSPHTPHLVPLEQRGGSGTTGRRLDLVVWTDAMLAKMYAMLDLNNLTDNALIIFTTDNGTHPAVGELTNTGHDSFTFLLNDQLVRLRGQKADIFEAGHRVPTVFSWPNVISKGHSVNTLLCQTDIFPTIMSLLGESLPDSVARDGVSFSPILLEENPKNLEDVVFKKAVIHHSHGGFFAIQKGDWKYIKDLAPDNSGGFTQSKNNLGSGSLYNLKLDISETTNLLDSFPAKVAELNSLLISYGYMGHGQFGNSNKNRCTSRS